MKHLHVALLPAKILTSRHFLSLFLASSKTVHFLVCRRLPLFLVPSDSSPIPAQITVRNSESNIFTTLFQVNAFCNIFKIFKAILSLVIYNTKTENNVADHLVRPRGPLAVHGTQIENHCYK